jgi:predicted homoserine dehydrogenase-like protein
VAAGKGKNNPLDRHANPTDEKWAKEAQRRGLNPNMLIEFVDGSKTMIEMAAVSNATGLKPDVRGMHGPKTSRDKLHETFALKEHGGILNRAGVVEYGIGGIHPGVFLVVTTSHPRLRQALVYRDMGNGPYYTLFRPYHLCSIEVPLTCAMLAIRKKSNMSNGLACLSLRGSQADSAGDRLTGLAAAVLQPDDTHEAAVAGEPAAGLGQSAISRRQSPGSSDSI